MSSFKMKFSQILNFTVNVNPKISMGIFVNFENPNFIIFFVNLM